MTLSHQPELRRGRPVQRQSHTPTRNFDQPSTSYSELPVPLVLRTIHEHNSSQTSPTTVILIHRWLKSIPSSAFLTKQDSIPPPYPEGWPHKYLPRLHSPSPPRTPRNQQNMTATAAIELRSRMNITTADRMRGLAESERQMGDARSDDYDFDDDFDEAWAEGMRQATARRKALSRARDGSLDSLPSNPWEGPLKSANLMEKARK